MGGLGWSYVAQFYDPIANKAGNLTREMCEYGPEIKEKQLLLFPLCPPKDKEKVTTFDVEVGTYSGEYNTLNNRSDGAFILAQQRFDEMLKDSKLESLIKQDETALTNLEGCEATLVVKELNDGSLQQSDQDKLKKTRKKLEEAKELISENVDALFSAYVQFMGVRHAKFNSKVSAVCHTTVEHDRLQVQFYKEAFHVDGSGSNNGSRFEEKDAEENEDPTPDSGWRFVHCWKLAVVTVTQQQGKGLWQFKKCREEHIRSELVFYGQAEKQHDYLMDHMSIPRGVDVRDLGDWLDLMSAVMPYLPSQLDDPNPAYVGKLGKITRRNVRLDETEMCMMLLNAMPVQVQKKWKSDHPRQKIPTVKLTLIEELQTLLDSHRAEAKKEKAQEKNRGGNGNSHGRQGNGGGSGNPKSGGGGSNRSTGNQKKMCDRCDKKNEPDRIKFSHKTGECQKYNQDGSAKSQQRERQKQLHLQQQAQSTPLSSEKKRKKKSKNKKKKKKKKKSKKKSYSSSSSSSSSSSDSEDSSDSSL